jgi:hypothetical protein
MVWTSLPTGNAQVLLMFTRIRKEMFRKIPQVPTFWYEHENQAKIRCQPFVSMFFSWREVKEERWSHEIHDPPRWRLNPLSISTSAEKELF